MIVAHSHKVEKFARYVIATLMLIVAINAFGGGYYGMAGAQSVPVEWLEGSPFSNYFIPGLVLFVIVGGSCLAAAILILKRHRRSRTAIIVACIIMLAWIVVQVFIIGYVSWMQPAIAVIGIVSFLLSLLLKK